jgi:hypothetical protein
VGKVLKSILLMLGSDSPGVSFRSSFPNLTGDLTGEGIAVAVDVVFVREFGGVNLKCVAGEAAKYGLSFPVLPEPKAGMGEILLGPVDGILRVHP